MSAGAGACAKAALFTVRAATITSPVRSSVRSFMGNPFYSLLGEIWRRPPISQTNSRAASASKAGSGCLGCLPFLDNFPTDFVQAVFSGRVASWTCGRGRSQRGVRNQSILPLLGRLVLPGADHLPLITWKHSYEVLQIVGSRPDVGRSHPRLSDRAGAGPAFGRCECRDCAAAASLLRAADHSGRGLYLGAWLLGLGCQRFRLLLGAGHLGAAAAAGIALDAGLLGLGRRSLRLPARILGPGSRLLRRHRLWLRLFRRRLLRRPLGPWRILLQPRGQQHHECEDHQRLQPDGGREQHGQSREFQRWKWRHGGTADTAARNLCARAACRGDAGTASAYRSRKQGPRVVLETESWRTGGRSHGAPRCHAG